MQRHLNSFRLTSSFCHNAFAEFDYKLQNIGLIGTWRATIERSKNTILKHFSDMRYSWHKSITLLFQTKHKRVMNLANQWETEFKYQPIWIIKGKGTRNLTERNKSDREATRRVLLSKWSQILRERDFQDSQLSSGIFYSEVSF